MTPAVEIALIALCILVQSLLSGSEYAIVGADRLVLKARADNGDKGAARVLQLLADPTAVISTCIAGINFATVAGATLVAHLLSRWNLGEELVVVATYTPLTVIFGELIPKSLFYQYATVIAPFVARPLSALATLLRPALWVIEALTKGVLRLFGVRGQAQEGHQVRREDIQLLLDSSQTGDIRADEKEMILRVFNFSETMVADAMVPLIEVIAIPEAATCDEAAAVLVEHGFSRLPVYRKRIDRIVGVVMHNDVLFAPEGAATVGSVMHDIMFVPETKRVDELFLDMRRRRQRVAVAVDEYGGAVGLISIEDILEEIVGNIEDEYDTERPLVRRVGEREWVASARVEAEELERETGFVMPEGDYETVAGFLLAELGHVPAVGEKLVQDGYVLTVTHANERAILEVDVHRSRAVEPVAEHPAKESGKDAAKGATAAVRPAKGS
jgi:CBS domain containing-hemolysin-like protein